MHRDGPRRACPRVLSSPRVSGRPVARLRDDELLAEAQRPYRGPQWNVVFRSLRSRGTLVRCVEAAGRLVAPVVTSDVAGSVVALASACALWAFAAGVADGTRAEASSREAEALASAVAIAGDTARLGVSAGAADALEVLEGEPLGRARVRAQKPTDATAIATTAPAPTESAHEAPPRSGWVGLCALMTDPWTRCPAPPPKACRQRARARARAPRCPTPGRRCRPRRPAPRSHAAGVGAGAVPSMAWWFAGRWVRSWRGAGEAQQVMRLIGHRTGDRGAQLNGRHALGCPARLRDRGFVDLRGGHGSSVHRLGKAPRGMAERACASVSPG
jgi:hypothetical protein